MSVPVNFERDPDMLIEELCKRFEHECKSQAPSADRYEQYKQNPFYPFESEKQWLEYDNQLIDKERAKDKAPSDNCTEDKHIKGCKCEAPSATVDEIEAYPTNLTKDEWSGATAIQCIQSLKFSKYQTPDGLHNLENNIAFHRLAELAGMNHENTIYTVDVMKSKDGQVFPVEEAFQIIRAINEVKSVNVTALDYIAQLHSQQSTVDVDALWDKHSIERNEMNYEGFKKAISELSQKRYTEQQMIDFAQMCQMESDGTKWEGNTIGRLLTKFDSEGNDGKV